MHIDKLWIMYSADNEHIYYFYFSTKDWWTFICQELWSSICACHDYVGILESAGVSLSAKAIFLNFSKVVFLFFSGGLEKNLTINVKHSNI